MQKLRRLWYSAKANWRQILPIAVMCLVPAGYVLGVLSTGLNPAIEGFSYMPWDAYGSLFSRSGQQVLVLLAGAGILIWLFVSMRKAKYAGLEKDGRNFYLSDKGTYGTARFMSDERMRRCFDVRPESDCKNAEGDIIGIKDGCVISLPQRSMLNRNVSVYGSSGSMKSRAVIRNQIIGSIRRGESMLITDPKGELFRDTAVWLRKEGNYLVRCLNLVSPDKSHGWNFMKDIQSEGEAMELSIVDQIAHTIIQNTGGKHVSKDDFWDKAENGLLKATILYQNEIYKQGRGPLNFPDAYRFLATHDVAQLKTEFGKLGMQNPFNPAYVQFGIFLKAGDKVCPNIHFGVLARLGIFNNPGICSIATRDEIDLELPARRKCAYFVITSDQDSSNDFIACLFFTLFYIRIVRYADTKTLDGRCPVPISLLLDEFPNIGEIPDFSKKIATTRSRSVATTVLFQSIPALKERYPNDAHLGILGNTDLSVFLGTTDPLTADFVSRRGGETSVLVESHMESHNKFDLTRFTAEYRESSGVGKRMIMTQDEVLTMGKDNPMQEIIVMKDQPILMCEKFDYTRDPESKKWEPFSMNDFNPRDAFWFDEEPPQADSPEEEVTPLQDTVKSPAVPREAEQAGIEPETASIPVMEAPEEKKTASRRRGRKEKEKPASNPEEQQSIPGFFGQPAREEEIPAFLTQEEAAVLAGDEQLRWPGAGETGYKGSGVEL